MTTSPSGIIVALDGGPVAERAIPVAVALAKQRALPITLVTVLSATDLADNASMYLKSRAEEIRGVEVSIEVLRGLPAVNTLVGYFEDHPGTLVCCSTHARLDSSQFMLGSVAEEIVRRSPSPVVLVGPSAEPPAPGDRFEDVVVCVKDGSADRLFPYLRHLSADFGLRPLLLHVLEKSVGNDRRRRDASALLEDLRQQFTDEGIDSEVVVKEDSNVPLAIVTVARGRAAPLIALSARDPREQYEETSVTVAIARISSCPVLVLGPALAGGDSDVSSTR